MYLISNLLITLSIIGYLLFPSLSNAAPLNNEIRYSRQVNQLLQQINPQNMWTNLSTLTQFPDRSAYHESGLHAAMWIKNQVEQMIQNSPRRDVSIYLVNTKGTDPYGDPIEYKQPSIVIRIGQDKAPGIVLGAHLDTLGCNNNDCKTDPDGPLPGADDDGSGIVTLLETTRTLLTNDIRFKKTIYIIWFAAEEEGRIGSIAVVNDFKNRGVTLDAMMQFDMTGYAHKNDFTLWFSYPSDSNKIDKALTNYTVQLAKYYVKRPVQRADYTDESDHWSFANAGYKAVAPLESNCHASEECKRREHTNEDTIDKLSLTHMTDYLKLAIAFAVELAEPI